ncbi:nitrite reductase [Phenylobacterium sp. Root77]|uniref:nitrite reductase large subunit NirB n=1 Tax=unclassified Phenylobacterium TaxID=2640670 RepID=UPI0006F65121|nr:MULTISPECIES: nitrite reductase large subunit NirB [unclassified Phenylobacterium]KQW71761.1 nitrite reductase [Phenylobacterium sp. Root1277]KQW94681.1 nitrite reductase [Phenylobacterium sp. Root1290]KRC44374.1 nitrite reductase [Phenylobacterium sp. Root77]
MPKEKLVVIGNGMAGCRAVQEVLKRDPDRYEITIFGAEPRVNYDRIMLSPVLAGEKAFEDIVLNDEAWYRDNGIALHAGHAVTQIDREAKVVRTASGLAEPYDRLLLAMGSDPVRLPLPGADLTGVVTFRDLDDVEAMVAAAAKPGAKAVVIGGGLLGIEAAYGLVRRGMGATVIHLMDVLMERQLDASAGFLLVEAMAQRGVDTVLGAQSEEIVGEGGKVVGLRLKDGRVLPCDILVMAVGIRPNVALARDSGLEIGRGVIVDDAMRTSDPAILAVGECAEHRGQCYGLVAPIWEMCKALGQTLTQGEGAYEGSVLSTRLKVSGVDVFSAGKFGGGTECEDIVFRDAGRGVYKRVVLENGKVAGAVLFGDAVDGPWYFDLMKSGAEVADIRETLIFGQTVTEGLRGLDPSAAVAAMADEAEVCGCNGVCKGEITGAITGQGLSTLDSVRAVTKASASCGSCTPLVEKLLKLTLGDGFQVQTGPKPVCGCTPKGHDEVRRRIVAEGLKSIPAAMQGLEWTTPDGCASCRPALNYYLLCAWPGEYRDDKQSRFINERAHANIQKDGTYSVVPRMWGGMTSAAELRAIADVVEKFDVPAVKVTGGQRIDLLGVKKDDLPAVWADLNAAGMVSGHAYAKGLRTVKTCVGSDWCRFGTQDSTGLGVRLEKFMWGSWAPAKVKLAVSGCPRNCAEATCKDIGVICVDSGYEIHVGGAAGLHIQGTEILTKVASEDEAVWTICAITQLYRENGWYLERIYKWMARVGLESIKAQVEDPEARKALYDRFSYSQRFSRIDPWAERVAGRHAEEFTPLSRRMEFAPS